MTVHTRWHPGGPYFGLHYDLHANETDTDLGVNANPETLVPLLKLMNPEWVQTDCKGHRGHTSWFSQVADATVSPGTVKDAMAGWRAATKVLDVPLHCHYSGIWDMAAAEKHPEWCVVDKDGVVLDYNQQPGPFPPRNGIMSPFGDYADTLLIPQMLELIDRYEVDGFWVDGEIWAVNADYGDVAVQTFTEQTGITDIPRQVGDPHWNDWMQFQRDAFHNYVTHYCEAVHQHKPGVLVCSNWLQTFRHPGEPAVPTDWISGDNTWVWGYDQSRCEARFISTRGKHWDIMLWGFYKIGSIPDQTRPWTFKPVQMLQQEAALTLALGGSVQIYEHPQGLRDGRLIPWRQERMGEVGQFVQQRRSLCEGSAMFPQVAVLHSETHYYHDAAIPFPRFQDRAKGVMGATHAFADNHYGIDILDEWALLPRTTDFAVIVLPECEHLSDDMVQAAKDYVQAGGNLLVTGTGAFDRFGADFLGVNTVEVHTDVDYQLSVTNATAPVYSATWRMLQPTTAHPHGTLGTSSLLDDRLLAYPAATINQVGQGRVAYVPCDLFTFYFELRYPEVRRYFAELTQALAGDLSIRLHGPRAVEMILRTKADATLVHLINQSSGIPNHPRSGAIDEIPLVGPITLEFDRDSAPTQVTLAFEDHGLEWHYADGLLTIRVERLHIHAAVVVT